MDFAPQREAMVALLRRRQKVSDAVAAAFLAVPRHLFLPGVDPDDAYRDEPIVTKRDADGRPISSSSQPAIMATMLDQLAVAPGHRVLEIGAGTGYNAALLAHLTGPEGRVVSIDIDDDIATRARRLLSDAGKPQVEVVCADGALGLPGAAPYDRLIATVGVWDLAPAWLAQLGPGGRLVVPLDLRGVQVSVAMEREGGHWASRSAAPCGFMRMRGPFAGTEAVTVLRRDPELTLALPEPRVLGDVLAALDAEPTEIVTEVAHRPEAAHSDMSVALWLALHEPRWCAVIGKLGPDTGYGMSAGLAEGDGIALLVVVEGSFAVRGHGAGGARLAAELAGHVAAWDEAGRPGAETLRVEAYEGPVPGDRTVIRKRHVNLALSFG
ncbi:methyltransferase, FxLD system [Nonomuraea sp. NPDC002799]